MDEHLSVSGEEKFPDDADALDYQLNWNDRFDSGEPVRSYRFDYPGYALQCPRCAGGSIFDQAARIRQDDGYGHERCGACAGGAATGASALGRDFCAELAEAHIGRSSG
jgi:hypothetical protein